MDDEAQSKLRHVRLCMRMCMRFADVCICNVNVDMNVYVIYASKPTCMHVEVLAAARGCAVCSVTCVGGLFIGLACGR